MNIVIGGKEAEQQRRRKALRYIRRVIVAAFWLSSVSHLAALALAAPVAQPEVAPYVWGGFLERGEGVARFQNSVAFLLDKGFHAIRFTVGALAPKDYGVDQRLCPSGQGTLVCYLQQQLDSPVFDDPRLNSLYITMEDVIDGGGDGLTSLALHMHRDALAADYAAAFEYLANRFKDRSNFPITILNWEADNRVYCGGAFAFAQSPSDRASCSARADLSDRMASYTEWMQLRRSLARVAARRYPRLAFQMAPEFNNINMFSDQCQPRGACDAYPTVITALSQGKRLPVCSYSAYEALNSGTTARTIGQLLRVCDKLILGEVGFKNKGNADADIAAKFRRLEADLQPFRTRIHAIIIWNAFEAPQSADPGFGLFGSDGTPLGIRNLPPELAPKSR